MYLSHIGAQSGPVTIDPCVGVIVTILFSVIDMKRIWNLAITIENSTQILWTVNMLVEIPRYNPSFVLKVVVFTSGKPWTSDYWMNKGIFGPPKTYLKHQGSGVIPPPAIFFGRPLLWDTAWLWVNVTWGSFFSELSILLYNQFDSGKAPTKIHTYYVFLWCGKKCFQN